MSFRIDVRADLKEVRKLFRELGPGVDRAAVRALNKTATTVKANAAREIQKQRNIKIGEIKKGLRMIRARKGSLTAIIEARHNPIAIRHFKARQTRQGVSVKIRKTGKPIRLQNKGQKSFIVNKFGGNVFVRKGKSRLPIQEWRRVPGISTVFAQDVIENHLRSTARDIWPKRFRQELNFEISKAERRARGA